MEKKLRECVLDFGEFQLPVELFYSSVAKRFYEALPVSVSLTTWGEEAYGSIGADLGEDKLQGQIPPGGLAYTRQGHYICIFYGQTPAWPVEYIGHIPGDRWQELLKHSGLTKVLIKKGS